MELPAPQGRNRKRRPAVILTDADEATATGVVVVVGISNQLDQSPTEVQVELPWHNAGHPRTGPKERCAAVCTWLAEVPLADVQGYGGTVPASQLFRIVSLVESLRPPDDQADAS